MNYPSWTFVIMVVYLVVSSSCQGPYGGCNLPSGGRVICGNNCTNVKPSVYRSLRQVYLDGELFVNFNPLSDLNLQIDNICYTFFPVAGKENLYVLYISRVYKNGTNEILTYLTTQYVLGEFESASPDCGPFKDTAYGVDGCGTFLNYRCYPCEGCPERGAYYLNTVYGLNRRYQQLTSSCLERAVQVTEANRIPPQQYVRLPMRLPPRCVTRQPCVNYPSTQTDCTT